jgi:hypothetical protein
VGVSRVSTLVTWRVIMAVCSFAALHLRDLGMAERQTCSEIESFTSKM